MGAGWGRHGPGQRYPAVCRQSATGGRFHNRSERTRPGVVVGSRPRNNGRRRYAPLGLPVVLHRRLPD